MLKEIFFYISLQSARHCCLQRCVLSLGFPFLFRKTISFFLAARGYHKFVKRRGGPRKLRFKTERTTLYFFLYRVFQKKIPLLCSGNKNPFCSRKKNPENLYFFLGLFFFWNTSRGGGSGTPCRTADAIIRPQRSCQKRGCSWGNPGAPRRHLVFCLLCLKTTFFFQSVGGSIRSDRISAHLRVCVTHTVCGRNP